MRILALIFFLTLPAFGKVITLETPQGGSFVLPTTEGVLSSDDLIGKHVFLTFGFAHCPDICPTTLRRMKQVAEKLTPAERANFRFLFVSVDNERDSIESLKKLKKVYGPSFIGATDTDERLTKLATSFGARYRRFKNNHGHLIVDHTDSIFHIDQSGKWIATLPYGSSVTEMITELRSQVAKPDQALMKARTATLLGKNDKCDLSLKACEIKSGSHTFTLEASPRPVAYQKPFKMKFTTTDPKASPMEADFVGVDLNMGYIRPRFVKNTLSTTLPVCELPKMRWRVRVILKDKYLDYFLTTAD